MATPRPTHRLLAVDDDAKILAFYRKLLTARGFEVTTCADSTKVLPLLKTTRFHVALLDLRMPKLDGTDLLPLMKRLRPELPVIVVSAYGQTPHGAYAQELGAADVVSKPFSQEALIAAVSRAVNEEEHIPLLLTSCSLKEGRELLYRRLILHALRKTGWNQGKAAALLGVSRYGLIRWIKRLNLSP